MKKWKIEGFDGHEKIFETKIKLGCLSENKLKKTLRVLTAKAGLSYQEIVGAYSRRGTKVSNELLAVQRNGPRGGYMCGENPHFLATVVDDDS